MQFLILNGNPDPSLKGWEKYLADFAARLSAGKALVILRTLRDLSIKPCTGCWTCWWSTPGRCSRRDDMETLYPEFVRADLIVWASPLVFGNVSALMKMTQDRVIPLLHPFIELADGECHHRRRYEKDIEMGLIVEPGNGDTDEDLAIVRHLHERLALNGRGRLRFFTTTDRPADEAAQAAEEAAYAAIGA